MSSPHGSTASIAKVLRRFRRNRQGSAAVEFALVAPMFFALLFAIIETALVFFSGQVLETVTQQAARLILTGQAQTAGYTQTQFKNAVCANVNVLFNCAAGVYIDVKSYSNFSSVTISEPIDSGKNFVTSGFKYCPGNGGDIVVVRLFYQWQLFVTGLGFNISNLTGGKRLLSATAAFQNEPFIAATSAC